MEIQNYLRKIDEGYLLGYIKYLDKYNAYFMPIAYWILNYKKYDPRFTPSDWEYVFRDNILNVSDDNIFNYLKSIDGFRIDVLALKETLNEFNYIDYEIYINFFIDCDDKKFVNGFYDITIEDYLPDKNWSGKFGNPIDFLPNSVWKII